MAKATKKRVSKRKKKAGSEDIFWTKIVEGFKKFCKSPFK
jgi:hypothetical protein